MILVNIINQFEKQLELDDHDNNIDSLFAVLVIVMLTMTQYYNKNNNQSMEMILKLIKMALITQKMDLQYSAYVHESGSSNYNNKNNTVVIIMLVKINYIDTGNKSHCRNNSKVNTRQVKFILTIIKIMIMVITINITII